MTTAALHFYLYRDHILDGFGLSPLLTWAVLIGSGYGCVRLARDVVEAVVSAYRTPPTETPWRRR